MKRATLPVGPEALAPEMVRELLRILVWLFGLLAARAAGDAAGPAFPFAPPSRARRAAAAVDGGAPDDVASDDADSEWVCVMVPAPWSPRFTRALRAAARPIDGLAPWLWRCARPPDPPVQGARMAAHTHAQIVTIY